MCKIALLLFLMAADITGTWKVVLEQTAVTSESTLVLTQKDNQITGTYNRRARRGQVRGKIDGNKIELNIDAEGPPPRTMTLGGYLESDGQKITGSYSAPGRGNRNGFLTATKVEAKKDEVNCVGCEIHEHRHSSARFFVQQGLRSKTANKTQAMAAMADANPRIWGRVLPMGLSILDDVNESGHENP